MLLNFHEQLISGIYLGKGLLVVLMFLELGPVYRSFMLPFLLLFLLFFNFFVVNVLYIEWDSQVGTWRSWESFPAVASTLYWSSLCLCTDRSH